MHFLFNLLCLSTILSKIIFSKYEDGYKNFISWDMHPTDTLKEFLANLAIHGVLTMTNQKYTKIMGEIHAPLYLGYI